MAQFGLSKRFQLTDWGCYDLQLYAGNVITQHICTHTHTHTHTRARHAHFESNIDCTHTHTHLQESSKPIFSILVSISKDRIFDSSKVTHSFCKNFQQLKKILKIIFPRKVWGIFETGHPPPR